MKPFKTRGESDLWIDVVVAMTSSRPGDTEESVMRRADLYVAEFQKRNAEFIAKAEELLEALAKGATMGGEFDLPKLKADSGKN
jgi:hypothetical protein